MAAPALWMLYPLGFLQSAVTGFIWATTGALAAAYVSEREQGQLAGVNAVLAGLMAMLGPLAARAAYDAIAPSAPFWMSIVVMIAAAVVMARVAVPGRKKSKSHRDRRGDPRAGDATPETDLGQASTKSWEGGF